MFVFVTSNPGESTTQPFFAVVYGIRWLPRSKLWWLSDALLIAHHCCQELVKWKAAEFTICCSSLLNRPFTLGLLMLSPAICSIYLGFRVRSQSSWCLVRMLYTWWSWYRLPVTVAVIIDAEVVAQGFSVPARLELWRRSPLVTVGSKNVAVAPLPFLCYLHGRVVGCGCKFLLNLHIFSVLAQLHTSESHIYLQDAEVTLHMAMAFFSNLKCDCIRDLQKSNLPQSRSKPKVTFGSVLTSFSFVVF